MIVNDTDSFESLLRRAVEALEGLAPGGPSWLDIISALAPWAAFGAAVALAIIGYKNLTHQREVLASNQAGEARAEWWRRVQWAYEAIASDDRQMNRLGAAVLENLIRSDMTNQQDKELLDATWQGSATAMSDEGIDQLLEDYERFSSPDKPPGGNIHSE